MAIESSIPGIVTGLITAAIVSHLLRSAMSSRAEVLPDGDQVLRYAAPMRIGMGICGLAIFALFASVPFWAPDEAKTPGAATFLAVVCIAMGSLGLYTALEFPFVRIVHDADRVTGFAPWRKPRAIAWSDVRSVQLHDALHLRVPREYWKSDHAAFHAG